LYKLLQKLKNNANVELKNMYMVYSERSKINFQAALGYEKNSGSQQFLLKKSLLENYVSKLLKNNSK
ncbi:UNVERIFIED_CONTAM: hypothetical protein O8I53_13885, partial [Campylobacter lari]